MRVVVFSGKRLVLRSLQRLKDTSGETLVETLISILVSSLAMVTLSMAITSSTNIIRRSRDVLESYYGNNNALAQHDSTQEESSDDVPVLKMGGATVDDFEHKTVKYYVNSTVHSIDGNPVVSYELS